MGDANPPGNTAAVRKDPNESGIGEGTSTVRVTGW